MDDAGNQIKIYYAHEGSYATPSRGKNELIKPSHHGIVLKQRCRNERLRISVCRPNLNPFGGIIKGYDSDIQNHHL